MQLYHILGLENVFSVFVREPEAGNYGKGGPGAGTVRARFPAKPKNSVFVREPEDGNYGKGGPDAGTVRARFPAKPMNSVFMREPEVAGGPDAGTVRARFPAKPMNSVFMREPEGGRRPPGRPHSGPCSGICTRKNLHFYTQSCIIIPTPLKNT